MKVRANFVSHQVIRKRSILVPAFLSLIFGFVFAATVVGQTTTITYQGKLNDGGSPANSSYDMNFRLFDALTNGNQVGATQTKINVAVVAGIFSVPLDFAVTSFSGADRFLEISISPAGQNNFTTLAPKQKLTSAPYAIQSLSATTAASATNALQLGGLAASQYVKTNDSRLADARNPLAGSSNYVQNTNTPQANVNFDIGGTGTANILNASTQFNLGGNRVLVVSGGQQPNSNIFAGVGSGNANTSGSQNAFFGFNAGNFNTSGNGNSFFGPSAGQKNLTGSYNSFFGRGAGLNNATDFNSFFGDSAGANNSTGSGNSFFGEDAGLNNTIGGGNSFFGLETGNDNTSGVSNSFFGNAAGLHNLTGSGNSFVGQLAAWNNTTGSNNTIVGNNTATVNTTGSNITIIGASANVGANNLSFATALGAGATVNSNNTLVLGRSADTVQMPGALTVTNSINTGTQFNLGGSRILSAGGTQNLFVGVGAGAINTGPGNSFFGAGAGSANTTGDANSFFGSGAGGANTGGGNAFFGSGAGVVNTTGSSNLFLGQAAGESNTTGSNNIFIGVSSGNPNTATQVSGSVAIGTGVSVSTSNTIVLGNSVQTTEVPGVLRIRNSNGWRITSFDDAYGAGIIADNLVFRQFYGGPAAIPICVRPQTVGNGDGGYAISNCTTLAAPLSYKTDLTSFSGGLEIINRLKPVAFKWKQGGESDFGLNAEDVAEVAPTLVTRNSKGEAQNVKSENLSVIFINAFKEQQAQIKAQQEELTEQQHELEALRKLVCLEHANSTVCTHQN